jgi:hypothetical protein
MSWIQKNVVDAIHRIILLLVVPICTRGFGAKMTGEPPHVWVPIFFSLLAGLY